MMSSGKKYNIFASISPIYKDSKAKKKHTVNDDSNNSSCDLAANLNNLVKPYLPMKKAAVNNIAIFANDRVTAMNDKVNEESRDKAIIEKKSSINNIPIIILACSVSSSLLSERSFMTTIVELKAAMTPMYTVSVLPKPRKIAKINAEV